MRRLAALVVLLCASCASEPAQVGVSEPIHVREGVFHRGELPAAQPPVGDTVPGPRISSFNNANQVVTWGQAGKTLDGTASPESYSVALRFADAGSGYWVVPVGAADPTNNGERVFSFSADFGGGLATGMRALELVAIDASGQAGPRTQVRLCIVDGLPGGDSVCNPREAAPEVVVSLSWDSRVDLDLVALTPSGSTIDWDHPSSDPQALDSPETALLTRNSNAGCVIDGINREDLVWEKAPTESGTWLVYANLFSACGQPSVFYRATLFKLDGNGLLVETTHTSGMLGALAANGGSANGTFVMEVNLP